MIKGENRPVSVIELDPGLIWREGTIFCPGNSACNEFDLESLSEADPVDTFDNLFPDEKGNWPTNYQAEVLLPGIIEVEKIKRVLFSHEEHRTYYLERAITGWRSNPEKSLSHQVGFVADPTKFPPGFNPSWESGNES